MKRTAEERFDSKVEKTATCWIWIGSRDASGYGRFRLDGGSPRLAHRVSYERARGPIPHGLTLDHLCRNRPCVNPAHLEAVTQRENLLRGATLAAINAAKPCCPSGHAYEPTKRNPSWRHCRECERARAISNYHANRDAINAARRAESCIQS